MKKTILEVDKYPEITFAPAGLEGEVNGLTAPIKITGWFAIHGDRHQITLPVELKRTGEEITATTHFLVPYVAWGMRNPSTFILRVKEDVEIQVTAVGTLDLKIR